MQFFERQDQARRKTTLLVVLFLLAVLGMIAALYGALWLGMRSYGRAAGLDWLLSIAVSVTTLVLLGTGLKSLQLRGGGSVVAKRLGGRMLSPDTREVSERRVLNVIEEMAIASGLPVPAVYVLDREGSINAFAAGWTPDDAAIGLSRGAVERLTRSELSGVVAHEYSHILGGDMRLNIRLMGVLHGIVMIGQIGAFVARVGARGGRHRRSGRGTLPLLVAGAAIWLVGGVGLLLGQLIKAAVSRQRELLADASAVQFTRDPAGLAGALKKIGSPQLGSRLESRGTAEASHLLFADGVGRLFGTWMATHPPLLERIRRLEPGFVGEFPAEVPPVDVSTEVASLLADAAAPGGSEPAGDLPSRAHLDYARSLLDGLPEPLVSACHDPEGAQAVVVVLLLGPVLTHREKRLQRVTETLPPPVVARVGALQLAAADLDTRARLPLLDLCLPALRGLPGPARDRLLTVSKQLIELDGQVALFEWSLSRVLRQHLYAHDRPLRSTRRQGVARSAQLLLSGLAHAGSADPEAAAAAYAAGAELAGLPIGQIAPAEECELSALDAALDVLRHAPPRRRAGLTRGMRACVAHDRRVSVREAELFRAVVECLGGSTPPLLAGQRMS